MGGIPQVGAEFAGYRIERLLGRGGVGIVFLALDLRLQRRVALKILATELSADERVRERFAREPRLAAAIDHPHIIPIYEAGEADGSLYIAMRYVDGCDLGVLVRRDGPLEGARAVTIVAQVASALDAAHARGLYHRDVKPANILVAPRPDPSSDDHSYVADFGITKNSSTRSLTKTGQYVGTLDYVAPEQIRGEQIDARTDIYALGCVLYESLTGSPPFQKDNDAASIYAHLAEDPPLLSERRGDLPASLDEVVVTAMAKSREQRYSSGAELAAAARRALGLHARGATRTRRGGRSGATTVIATPLARAVPPTAPRSTPDEPETVVVPAVDVADTVVVATPRPAPRTPEPQPAPAPKAPAARLDFRVLGPLEVWDGDREVPLGTGRQRALLGRLLLDVNMVVSSATLADALWGDRTPPESAAKALQTHVTTLRRMLEPNRPKGAPSIVVTRAPGYLLRVDADDVDLGRFERLLEQGRRLRRSTPERAATVLAEALSLWRGAVLADVTLEGAARAEVQRVEEMRLAALEERIAADLDLGRHAAVLEELTGLATAHPERERLQAQLTVARARSAVHPVEPPEEDAVEAEPAPKPVKATAAKAAVVRPRTATVRSEPARARTAAAKAEPAGAAPPPRRRTAAAEAPPAPEPRRRRRPVAVLAAAAVLVGLAAGAGALVHSRTGGGPARPPVSGPGAYPTAQEKTLAARFPPFVEGCHRYADHYEKAIAEVECRPSADHPGAKAIVFQQFSNYGDLELHFHHVLALNIQSEAGKPVSSAFSGPCSDPASGFFAASTYPIEGVEAQDAIASPTAHGHLFCYVGRGGVPKLAWTNVGELIVAQAVGDGTGEAAQTRLLSLWEFAGPTGSPAPVAGSPDTVVKMLYQRYLQRDPESPEVLDFWVRFLNDNGFAKTSNRFADTSEAKTRFTLPLLRGGAGHGGETPAPTPAS